LDAYTGWHLAIAHHLLADFKADKAASELAEKQLAMTRAANSGCTAWQFVAQWRE